LSFALKEASDCLAQKLHLNDEQLQQQSLSATRTAALLEIKTLPSEQQANIRQLLSDYRRWSVAPKGGCTTIYRGIHSFTKQRKTLYAGKDAIAVALNVIKECSACRLKWQDMAPLPKDGTQANNNNNNNSQQQAEPEPAAVAAAVAVPVAVAAPAPTPAAIALQPDVEDADQIAFEAEAPELDPYDEDESDSEDQAPDSESGADDDEPHNPQEKRKSRAQQSKLQKVPKKRRRKGSSKLTESRKYSQRRK
jgi:hypothetical protein